MKLQPKDPFFKEFDENISTKVETIQSTLNQSNSQFVNQHSYFKDKFVSDEHSEDMDDYDG